jgi:hypothetical protein
MLVRYYFVVPEKPQGPTTLRLSNRQRADSQTPSRDWSRYALWMKCVALKAR